MKTKRWTAAEIQAMPEDEFLNFRICLDWGCLRLLGIFWDKYWRGYVDTTTGDLVIEYE